ncbi:hypothetical protein L5515_009802 [Caenorhabditis briggsae]|uniref:Uncharacterized protein n=1 Tax=Caenorhabditis briggsae TaxID=6238 RepID=A0AAE9JQH7_CAEBR|nr:hypothetical protein L5515_009802 [Caenorhabditis briggsae]
MAMIILLLTSLAIGSASGQEDAAIIAPIKPLPVKPVLPSITCANVLCIMNSTCVMYEALDGKMKPYCLPIDYENTPINPLPVKPVLPSITCANVLCIMNSTCVMYEALDGKMKPYCLPIDYKNKKLNMIILLLAILAIGSTIRQEDAAIIGKDD